MFSQPGLKILAYRDHSGVIMVPVRLLFFGGGHPVLKYMHVHVCIFNPGQASIGVVLNCSSVTIH